MSKPANKPPHPITAILILTLVTGLVLMLILAGSPGHKIGIAMVVMSAIGLIWRHFTKAKENAGHTELHTSGADRGKSRKH